MESNNGGLGKLLSKSITSKRRRKKQQSDASSDEQGRRGRSPAASLATNESDSTNRSLPMGDEDEPSLISIESETDESLSAPGRPTVIASAHPSQIGCLTTSSPLIQEEHLRDSQDSALAITPRSTTFPAKRTTSEDSIPSLSQSKTGLALPQSNASARAPSPVGRFREVFRSKKGSTDSVNSTSERKASPAQSEPPAAPAARVPGQGNASEAAATSRPAEPAEAPKKNASTERFRRLSKGQTIDTVNPPRTPPNAESATPVIVNTPPTPTDHFSPTIPPLPTIRGPTTNPTADSAGNASVGRKSKEPPPPLGSMISERRVRSGSGNLGPSKLSNTTLAPLSPTPEIGPAPSTPSAASFFSSFGSSMISAAQSAATTLTNTIQNTNLGPAGANANGRTRGSSLKEESGASGTSGQAASNDRVEVEPFPGSTPPAMGSKEPAVRTLGLGDLSLSQLGIAEPAHGNGAAQSTASKFPDSADARSRSESAPVESHSVGMGGGDLHPDDVSGHAHSGRDANGSAEQTTPAGSVYEDKNGLQRTGSIRSAIGRHRKRNSSAATGGTGGTIAAAISAANASVAHPSAQGSTTKLTGFAVASKKRNRDFHALFKSVPDDDYLIEDYSCALQREILAHGRLYVSEGHLCFSSNIFGWVTTLVMSFNEIVSVEKRSTALVFKNGLMISTLHAKHVFASFTSRDSTYDLIVKIWKLGHPSLQSSLNGVRLDETGGDKTEKVVAEVESVAPSQSGSGSEDESGAEDEEDDEEVYDEDEEDGQAQTDAVQPAELRSVEADADKAASMRKPSGGLTVSGPAAAQAKETPPGAGAAAGLAASGGSLDAGADFPGPATHAPTNCSDSDQHYDKIVGDDTVPAPLGKVFSLVFGHASPVWVSKWLTQDQKCFDLQMEDQKGLGPDNRTRTFSYTKPLPGSIGPRQTKCIITEHVDAIDFEKAVSITCTTQTPDVPSGGVFSTKTKYCLSWAENNATRVQVNCTIEWTGKSWLKGPIEKGANDGQLSYVKDLMASLKAAVTSRSRAGTAVAGAALAKGGKKKRKGKAAAASAPTSDGEGISPKAVAKKQQSWGIFEPVHGIVGPVVDIVKPLITGNVVYGLLVGLLVASWFGFGLVANNNSRPAPGVYGGAGREYGYYHPQFHHPDRLAAYEEMWRREESELWDWLEDRVGLGRLSEGDGSSGEAGDRTPPHAQPIPASSSPRGKPGAGARTAEEKLREARADDREIRDAIRVTEEKLKALKSAIEKKNA